MSSLKFGTSGLRGHVTELLGWPAYSYTLAFCRLLSESGGVAPSGAVLVGRDLRDSSPEIAALCGTAIRASGLVPIDCGALPTPALALYGQRIGAPSVMVTGSHIPEDRNGLKFYRATGEISKADETAIVRLQAGIGAQDTPPVAASTNSAGAEAVELYRRRYLDFFAPDALRGLTVGVYQHSSVARDLLVDMLDALGAHTIALGRSDRFVPVDTEALRSEDIGLLRTWAQENRLDAVVSTDGDADRPLIADENGNFVRGDLVGTITAARLRAAIVVTPVTSNSAIEQSGRFRAVERTRVGSPFVIAGMDRAKSSGGVIVGFEANGGVLLGTDVTEGQHRLPALPTRDALLPILCVLAEISQQGQPLSLIAKSYGFKAAAADRLQHVSQAASASFLGRLGGNEAFRTEMFDPIGGVAAIDDQDGIKISTGRNETVHFRASGNAPELRCYAEAASEDRAHQLLSWGLDLARRETNS